MCIIRGEKKRFLPVEVSESLCLFFLETNGVFVIVVVHTSTCHLACQVIDVANVGLGGIRVEALR